LFVSYILSNTIRTKTVGKCYTQMLYAPRAAHGSACPFRRSRRKDPVTRTSL